MRSSKLILFFIVLSPLFFSFCFFKSKSRDYQDMANEISIKVATKLAKKHGMDWIGEGGGMMGSVYMIHLGFQIHHPMDQNEARERIVDCAEEILKAINENEEIRPYLKNYPFTTENLQVAIYINYADGREALVPDCGVVSIYQSDNICYSYVDDNHSMKYKKRIKESYKEVYAALKSQKGKCSSTYPFSNSSISK